MLDRVTFSFRCVSSDGVEDVDKDEKESDEERHPAGDHVGGDDETDPGHNNEQSCSGITGSVSVIVRRTHIRISHKTTLNPICLLKEQFSNSLFNLTMFLKKVATSF